MLQAPAWCQGQALLVVPKNKGGGHIQKQFYWKILQDEAQSYLQIEILCVYFAECGLEHLELQIIDCVKEGRDMALIQLEGVWQNRLATFNNNNNIRNELR